MRIHRELRCHACGRELSGGLDTYEDVGLEMCEQCETALLSEENTHFHWRKCECCGSWSWWGEYSDRCPRCEHFITDFQEWAKGTNDAH